MTRHARPVKMGGVFPREGTFSARVLGDLPATNHDIANRYALAPKKVARIMADLIHRGLAVNMTPGRGYPATYEALAREQREHSSPLAPVAADPGGTETKPEQNLHEKGSEG